MFRRRRVRHAYPQPVVDLVVRLAPVHGAMALSRILDIPKSVIYRWCTTNTGSGAPSSAAADPPEALATLFARCQESGFPLRRYARGVRAVASAGDVSMHAEMDGGGTDPALEPVSCMHGDATDREAGPGQSPAAVDPRGAHAARSRRAYVYDACKERPVRGVRSRMEAVRETLDTRYFLDVDCRSLAESAGMSHYHFIRVFRAIFGTSPHQYLTRRRVEAAKRLLLGSTEPIEVIAVGVGFRSGPSMSRAFKRIEGASASRFFHATSRDAKAAVGAAPESG